MNDDKKQPDFGLDLQGFVGQVNTTEVQRAMKAEIEKVFQSQPGITESKVTKCTTLWKDLTLKEKFLWLFNNFFFKSKGQQKRKLIEDAHDILASRWRGKNPNADWSDCPYHLEYPRVLQSSPKSIIVVESNIKLAQSLEYIPITLEIKE